MCSTYRRQNRETYRSQEGHACVHPIEDRTERLTEVRQDWLCLSYRRQNAETYRSQAGQAYVHPIEDRSLWRF